jgi:putative ABC transport system ATP-binding protein/lipoprotein-releasing system ATP-binding protein
MALLEARDISKVFTVGEATIAAVQGASLRIEKGEFLSIVGHSGSGKTTLLSILGGILRPTSGQVLFQGQDIYRMDDDGLSEYRARHVGYVFQFASLLPVLTARENLLLPTVFLRGRANAREAEKALRYLEMVGLAEKADAYPYQLSGGQQRRVAIARALMNDPEIILADEPTGDLDEETEQEVMEFFKKVNREMGITFVLVTHSLELASAAHRRFRMTHGRLHEETAVSP